MASDGLRRWGGEGLSSDVSQPKGAGAPQQLFRKSATARSSAVKLTIEPFRCRLGMPG